MDNSRDHDLAELSKRMNDPTKPMWVRKSAWRTFNKILSQVSDKKLVELRHRLIRANIASDVAAVAKIELQIKDYTKQRA